MKSRLTLTLAALMVVAATSFAFATPAENAPAPVVIADWSALDQPVDTTYTATHASSHGLQAVVAEIRATLSSLVQQFRALVTRVDQNDADITAIKQKLGMADDNKAPDKKDAPGATADQSDDKKPGPEEGTGKSPETQTGTAAPAPAPAPADDSTQKAPAQAGAGAPAVVDPATPAAVPAKGNQTRADTPTLGEKLQTDVDNLASSQNLLTVLVLGALILGGIALYRALRADQGVVNVAKSTHFALGNGKNLAEGGTFPDHEDVYKSALVAAWLERGGAPLEQTVEPAGDLADEVAKMEAEEPVAGPVAEEAAKPAKPAPKK